MLIGAEVRVWQCDKPVKLSAISTAFCAAAAENDRAAPISLIVHSLREPDQKTRLILADHHFQKTRLAATVIGTIALAGVHWSGDAVASLG